MILEDVIEYIDIYVNAEKRWAAAVVATLFWSLWLGCLSGCPECKCFLVQEIKTLAKTVVAHQQ